MVLGWGGWWVGVGCSGVCGVGVGGVGGWRMNGFGELEWSSAGKVVGVYLVLSGINIQRQGSPMVESGFKLI